jgi:hypothetical protein
MHTGGCLCGAIRYAISGPLEPIQFCHCSQCRRASGSAFAANMPVRAADFRVTDGETRLKAFASKPGKERIFCADCGSQLFSRNAGFPDYIRLRVGGLDAPAAPPLAFHFHVASKAPWWPINDELPQHPAARPPGP